MQSKDTADVNGTSSQATPSEAWWRTRSIVTRRSSGRRCGLERWRGNELNTELGARYSTRWLRSGCPIRTAPGDSATGTGRSAICSGPCNNAELTPKGPANYCDFSDGSSLVLGDARARQSRKCDRICYDGSFDAEDPNDFDHRQWKAS